MEIATEYKSTCLWHSPI